MLFEQILVVSRRRRLFFFFNKKKKFEINSEKENEKKVISSRFPFFCRFFYIKTNIIMFARDTEFPRKSA